MNLRTWHREFCKLITEKVTYRLRCDGTAFALLSSAQSRAPDRVRRIAFIVTLLFAPPVLAFDVSSTLRVIRARGVETNPAIQGVVGKHKSGPAVPYIAIKADNFR